MALASSASRVRAAAIPLEYVSDPPMLPSIVDSVTSVLLAARRGDSILVSPARRRLERTGYLQALPADARIPPHAGPCAQGHRALAPRDGRLGSRLRGRDSPASLCSVAHG